MKGSIKILGDIIEPALEPGWEEEMLKSWDEIYGKGPAEPREDD